MIRHASSRRSHLCIVRNMLCHTDTVCAGGERARAQRELISSNRLIRWLSIFGDLIDFWRAGKKITQNAQLITIVISFGHISAGKSRKKIDFLISTFSNRGNYADSKNVIFSKFGAKKFLPWNFQISIAKI